MAESKVTPLDAERERLRTKGLTEDEISRIFIAREIGNGAQSGDATNNPITQFPMTGVLGNAHAVLSHAKGAIPVLKGNFATLSSAEKPKKSRVKSAIILLSAIFIGAVLGFAVYQEWQRHIIFETEIQKEQAASAHAQSCQARWRSATGSDYMSVEPAVDTPAIRQIVAECTEFFLPEYVKELASSVPSLVPDKLRTYDECREVVALRNMVAQPSLTHQVAEQQVKTKGVSDPEIVECMKLSEEQARAVKPTTINECRDWAIVTMKHLDPTSIMSEVAEKLAKIEPRLGKNGFVEKCMAGHIE